MNIIVLLVVLILGIRCLKKDFISGLGICIALLVTMPDYLRISAGGGIPELTIQRLLLGVLFLFWLQASKQFPTRPAVPFGRLLYALAGAQFLSLLFSISTSGSVKSLFVFCLEIVLFFVIVTTSLQDRESVLKVLYSVGIGLGIVSLLAAFERWYGLNPSREWLADGGRDLVDVTATYPHRILLGYAMAMAVPILLSIQEREERKKMRYLLWVMLLLVMAGCYFANSRGPWSGMIVGALILMVLGSRAMKRAFVFMGILSLIVIATRSGVRETIVSAIESTFQQDSVKGHSYEYRWRLWFIAYTETGKSMERTMFGYGGLSTETMDLGDYFEKESGGTTAILGYTSWDNQMACDLIEFGYVGFGIEAILLVSVLVTLGIMWYRSSGADRSIMAAFIATGVIYIYALSNVYIFSPQLKCLFWALIGCGLRYGQLPQTVTDPEAMPAEPEPAPKAPSFATAGL